MAKCLRGGSICSCSPLYLAPMAIAALSGPLYPAREVLLARPSTPSFADAARDTWKARRPEASAAVFAREANMVFAEQLLEIMGEGESVGLLVWLLLRAPSENVGRLG